ncbi:hypothetical protein ACVOMV_17765 [Mesorhizobium atlanticum]
MHLVKTGEMLSTMYIDGFVQGATATALAFGAITGDIDLSKLGKEQRDFYLSQTLVNKDNVDAILAKKNDPAAFSYDKVKANFWASSVGQIPAGANK